MRAPDDLAPVDRLSSRDIPGFAAYLLIVIGLCLALAASVADIAPQLVGLLP